MRIVQLEGESLIAAVRRPAFAHEWVEYPGTLPGQVVERLRGAAVAITNKVPLDATAIAALPELTAQMDSDRLLVVNVSGRGDKDIFTVADALGVSL